MVYSTVHVSCIDGMAALCLAPAHAISNLFPEHVTSFTVTASLPVNAAGKAVHLLPSEDAPIMKAICFPLLGLGEQDL